MKRFERLLFLVGLFGEAIGDDQKSVFLVVESGFGIFVADFSQYE